MRITFGLFIFLFFVNSIYSQRIIEEVKLSNGKTIIIYDNYTWNEKASNNFIQVENSNVPTEYSNGTRVLRRSVEVKEGNKRRNIISTTQQPATSNPRIISNTNTEIKKEYIPTQKIDISDNKTEVQTQAKTNTQSNNNVSVSTKPKTSTTSTYSSSSKSTGGTVYVKGYYRKDGTYVKSHTRRAPSRRR